MSKNGKIILIIVISIALIALYFFIVVVKNKDKKEYSIKEKEIKNYSYSEDLNNDGIIEEITISDERICNALNPWSNLKDATSYISHKYSIEINKEDCGEINVGCDATFDSTVCIIDFDKEIEGKEIVFICPPVGKNANNGAFDVYKYTGAKLEEAYKIKVSKDYFYDYLYDGNKVIEKNFITENYNGQAELN